MQTVSTGVAAPGAQQAAPAARARVKHCVAPARSLAQWPIQQRRPRSGDPPRAAGGGFGAGMFDNMKKIFSGEFARPSPIPPGTPEGLPENLQYIPYRVIRSEERYTLRLYQVYPVIAMEYGRREEGYLKLGEYLDGANTGGALYAATQPVVMSYEPNGGKRMQMFVGPRRGEEGNGFAPAVTALPAPTDPAVRLEPAGGEILAVLRFEGYITPETAAAVRKQLAQAVEKDGMRLGERERAGYFRIAQYGAMYSLKTRVNEMLLQVEV